MFTQRIANSWQIATIQGKNCSCPQDSSSWFHCDVKNALSHNYLSPKIHFHDSQWLNLLRNRYDVQSTSVFFCPPRRFYIINLFALIFNRFFPFADTCAQQPGLPLDKCGRVCFIQGSVILSHLSLRRNLVGKFVACAVLTDCRFSIHQNLSIAFVSISFEIHIQFHF